jgi:hypothetical protein
MNGSYIDIQPQRLHARSVLPFKPQSIAISDSFWCYQSKAGLLTLVPHSSGASQEEDTSSLRVLHLPSSSTQSPRHKYFVTAAVFLNESQLVSASKDALILWNLPASSQLLNSNGRLEKSDIFSSSTPTSTSASAPAAAVGFILQHDPGYASHLAMDTLGSFLACCIDNEVCVLDMTNYSDRWTMRLQGHLGKVTACAFWGKEGGDKNMIVSVSEDRTFKGEVNSINTALLSL